MNEFLLDKGWKEHLENEWSSPYMIELQSFLIQERKQGKEIYPSDEEIFTALNLTPLNQVKVVILGQDPYHGPGQAHGLCFSVRKGVKLPPSLKNIFKELKNDLGEFDDSHGHLSGWASQGVLLLNTVLTVESGLAGSHHLRGWETFTDRIIEILNREKHHLVFILWGSPAQKKASHVDKKKHHVIESPHPSPLSSYRGFFGSKPFSQTNQYLVSRGLSPIDWKNH